MLRWIGFVYYLPKTKTWFIDEAIEQKATAMLIADGRIRFF
jgi:hypothetical protein